MKLRNIIITVLTIALLSCSLCCCKDSEKGGEGKLKVVATLFPHYDFARTIGGDRANVIKLLPNVGESHTYDPSVKDIAEISTADIFLYTGEHMEAWAGEIIESLDSDNVCVVDLSKGIELMSINEEDSHNHTKEDSHSHDFDAHIWTSPTNAEIMVDTILEAFCAADSENEDYYRHNADALKKELRELDNTLTELSASYDGRTLYFGGRFAFLYMFHQYGFNYRTPYRGCGEESEPGIKVISDIVSEMKGFSTEYIFCEEMSEGKIAKSIAEETGAKLLVLHSCHNISKSEEISGETYISLMKKNIENLKLALGQLEN